MGRIPDKPSDRARRGNPSKAAIPKQGASLGMRTPRMPKENFSEAAKKVWKKTIRDMRRLNILDAIDEDALAQYCTAMSHYLLAAEKLQDQSNFIESGRSGGKPSGWFKIYDIEAARVSRLADKLGMTPSSRRRLSVEFHADPEKDPYARFRKKRDKRD